jgi:hypothetical protein
MNNLVDCDLALDLRIDGELVQKIHLHPQQYGCRLGIYRSSNSVLPFKFQELNLVGVSALPRLFSFVKPIIRSSLLIFTCRPKTPTWKMLPSFPPKWGRSNFGPIVIGLCAWWTTSPVGNTDSTEGVCRSVARRLGGIMSGRLVSPPKAHPSNSLILCVAPLFDLPSTDDEIPINGPAYSVIGDYIDPPGLPCATFKVFYRPRGRSFMHSRAPSQCPCQHC